MRAILRTTSLITLYSCLSMTLGLADLPLIDVN